jgi:hypothetical protein
MSHYKANIRDLHFNLFEVLDLGTLLDEGAYGDLDSETAKAMLNEVAHFSPRCPHRTSVLREIDGDHLCRRWRGILP